MKLLPDIRYRGRHSIANSCSHRFWTIPISFLFACVLLEGEIQDLRDPANILMPVETIYRSQIEDYQADDLLEALTHSAGLVLESIPLSEGDLYAAGLPIINKVQSLDYSPSNSGGAWGHLGKQYDNAIAIRGFTNPTQQRMGFRVGASYGDGRSIGSLLDTVNIDHIRVYRGPAGLLFGQNTLSGVVEIVPKKPLSHAAQWIRMSSGSNGYRRLEADLTGPLLEHLNYRVTGAIQSEDDWTQWKNEDRKYTSIQLGFDPFPAVNCLVEYQVSNDRHEGIGPRYAFDVQESDLEIDHEGRAFGEPINWALTLSDTGAGFRWSGPDTFFDRSSIQLLGLVDIRLADSLKLSLSGCLNRIDTDERNMEIKSAILSPFAAKFYPEAEYLGGAYFRILNGTFYDYALSVDNVQLKAELSYQMNLLGGIHLFTVGMAYLRDNIRESGVTPDIGKLSGGVRKSVFDASPFEYTSSSFYEDQILNYYYGAHMVQDDTFWTQNEYLLYRGMFLNERVQVFLGSRWERFHARELRRSRDPERDVVVYEARREIGPLRSESGYRYNGKPLYLNSLNGGVGFRLSDSMTLYTLSTEGYNPNQGQVDGNGKAIGEEQTGSVELGFQFDWLDGRLTGWMSAYRIERDNAVWSSWLEAPAPVTWIRSSGSDFDVPPAFVPFDPVAAADGSAPLSYGIRKDFLAPDQLQMLTDGTFLNPAILGSVGDYVYIDYAAIDDGGLRGSMEEAFQSDDPLAFTYDPVWVEGRMLGNNPDAIVQPDKAIYANIPFEETVKGMDFQFTYTPLPNWQVEVKYAFNNREVTGMTVLDYVDPETEINWGTEFNKQARTFGQENFADPSRPSTVRKGLLLGQDYGIIPEQILTIWSRYQFENEPLLGLSFGLGLRYTGSQPTSVGVGGTLLERNAYPTPDIRDYWSTDLTIGYRKVFRQSQMKFQLTVFNLMDSDSIERVVVYHGPQGEAIRRRSYQQIAPLSIRISASISF